LRVVTPNEPGRFQMTNTNTRAREALADTPLAILQRLPRMGRVMMAASQQGVTHERLGVVERVAHEDGRVICGGASHDATIELAAIASVVADRTGKMKDKILPRLEFHDAAGEQLFSVVGLDGLEPFDAGLAGIGGEAVPERTRTPTDPATLADSDPGNAPFAQANAAGADVSIEIRRNGFTQAWRGVIAEVKPAMGFINVMKPDFHMHLRGGAVARWSSREADGAVEMVAQNEQGEAIGLVVRGPKGTFG
jgi:putative heme degradation protein